ncbi:hypothetical protein ACQP2F_15655 [Actinoplanes sp. CA-030573]|uniref:hypothetical protein n=1 Tax=Actinoplanes sp. CA-030573 TaxID=3239898 RepID=UPI003D8B257E
MAGFLFLNQAGYMECSAYLTAGEREAGVGGELWPHRDWLPGPVQILGMTSSEEDHGWVQATGRVSPRVDHLVLEHGDGQTTAARIDNGTFGLISRNDDVTPAAALVRYGSTGQEFRRKAIFALQRDTHCYTDHTGKLIYRETRHDCLPADPWIRQSGVVNSELLGLADEVD